MFDVRISDLKGASGMFVFPLAEMAQAFKVLENTVADALRIVVEVRP